MTGVTASKSEEVFANLQSFAKIHDHSVVEYVPKWPCYNKAIDFRLMGILLTVTPPKL